MLKLTKEFRCEEFREHDGRLLQLRRKHRCGPRLQKRSLHGPQQTLLLRQAILCFERQQLRHAHNLRRVRATNGRRQESQRNCRACRYPLDHRSWTARQNQNIESHNFIRGCCRRSFDFDCDAAPSASNSSFQKTRQSRTVRTPPSFVAHNEIWTLTSNTDVLTSESGAIAHVHAGRTIHVIGISADGEYLQVVLRDRRRGFVVASAAQYKSNWKYDGSK
jgi:hypothetical protein